MAWHSGTTHRPAAPARRRLIDWRGSPDTTLVKEAAPPDAVDLISNEGISLQLIMSAFEFCEVFAVTDNAHGKVKLFKRNPLPQIAPSADEMIE